MLVGFYFDWFLVFLVGAIWAGALSRMPDAPPWTGRWFWIVGGLYLLCWVAAAGSMMQAVGAPPVPGEVSGPMPGETLLRWSRIGTQATVAGGYVWLVVLTAQTFGTTSGGEDNAG